jgi:asparagine synthase (glutamine-hydrolysing)
MCGFVSIINKNFLPVDPDLLTHMASLINYRGPDDEGCFIDNNIGFFHKRLSIIDLALGKQPMSDNDITIVFNGEIYNYKELREDLIKCGYSFRTNSDTEVIIKMYEKYGVDSVNLLNGMFSFLIYDKQKNRILAARDHFGIKPLYFVNNIDHILFASEIKSLLQHPSVNIEPDFEAINEYLTFQFVLEETTMFKNVYKLLPGHYLTIDLQSMDVKMQKYWIPNFTVDTYHTEEYFKYEIRRLIEDTIKIQLRSDVPLGGYLSGGMDSSIVTILASSLTDSKFKTFTGAFKESKEFNETEYSREVAATCNAEVFEIYPTENDFIDLMPKIIYHMDEPAAGPGVFPQFMVSQLASKNVKVVLGGQGGDEIFGGYARYVVAYLEQAVKGAIFESNEEGEHIVSLHSILPNLPYLKQYTPMMQEFNRTEMFMPMDLRYFKLIDRMNGSRELFNKDFIHLYNKESIFARFQSLFNNPNTKSYYNKMTHFDMCASLPALLQVEDRVSMASSLESRVPLLDRRIADVVASMPPAMKFKGAEMKYILKKSISNILPQKILNRKDKMGFPVPLHIWAKNKSSDFFRDVLLSEECRNRGIFNPDKIELIIKNERSFGRTLWGMLCLELWFNEFIDKDIKKFKVGQYEIK